MDLILVRHAIAEERDPERWPTDRDRPLTTTGIRRFERAASGLKRVQESVDLVLSSPYVRAWQTAQILEEFAGWPEPVACPELEPMNDTQTVIELCARVNGAVVAFVAHEPLLGELAAVLMAGFGAPAQPLKKGAAVAFSSEHGVTAGGVELRWWLTPKLLRLLAT
ncbi:MAG TPA: phosphohistidine phosphatase SixA [Nitrolancea sp.]|jgi:phosphohistidine phosphatase|nr:phosphohistidine phosphatase SixA [Nitrolancea sp.]